MADRLTQALSGKICGFEDEAAGTRAFLADAEDLARRCADSIGMTPYDWRAAGRAEPSMLIRMSWTSTLLVKHQVS